MRELPPGWSWSTLGDLLAELRNGVFVSRPGRDKTERPILRISAVRPMALDIKDVRYLPTATVVRNEESSQVKVGDLLFTRYSGNPDYVGACGMVRQSVPNLLYPDKLIRGRVIPGVEPGYLETAMAAPETRAEVRRRVKTTAGQVGIAGSDLRSVPIPVPPLAEQERIVAAIEEQFSRLDAAVVALKRVQQNLKRMRSAAFALIADSVDAWRPLGEIAEVVGGVTKDAKRQSDPSFVEVPYLRVANVQRGYLDLTAVTTIRVPGPTADKLRLEPGDILFNEGGDRDKLGRGWIWEGQIKDCIHQNHVFRARLHTKEFEPKFISMHGNSFGRTWFDKMGKQTTNLASLNLTTLKSFPVPDLPIERQREIVAEVERRLSLLDSLQSVADHSLMRCSLLRSSILAAAFSGQLVSQDPGEEPASVLLERIAANGMRSNSHTPRRDRKSRGPQEGATA
jgi:type I restriction enzyme S subunit